MELIKALVLGALQGATEFIPVSSSGHLVIVPALLGWKEPNLTFAMALHMGTFLAVFIYYFKDVVNLIKGFFATFKRNRTTTETFHSKLCWLIIIALIPAGIAGLIFSNDIDRTFGQPHYVSYFFFVTAFLLIVASLVKIKEPLKIEDMGIKNALAAGLLQIISLLPGVSRSGATMSGGIFSGMNKEDAAKFSFLLSIPTILGAGILTVRDMFSVSQAFSMGEFFTGFLAAFIVGILSIKFFFSIVRRTNFYFFAIYCILIGVAGLIFI